ncbi:MAG: chloride channel protein [Bacteroidales bacterium]|nr:chloride channel protein [Bacteroidales bacterium]
MSENNTLLARFLFWRIRHVKQKQFILLLSFLVGLVSGIAAVLLKKLVHFISHNTIELIDVKNASFLYILYPLIGILITVLFVRYVVKENIGHGVSKILFSISQKNGNLKTHNSFSSFIASALTVGFGGSVGLEAPVVLTGSSIGSTLSRLMKLNYRETTLMIGCGAAGALAGIFKAPIAALVFGLEVLLLDLTMASLIPMLISAVTGATVAYLFSGSGLVFSFELTQPFLLSHLPYFALLGVVAGLISVYFTKATMVTERWFSRISNTWLKWLAGGLTLGLLVYVFPPLYGEGYETLLSLLHNEASEIARGQVFGEINLNEWSMLGFLVLVLVFKVFASSATNGSGGVGGIFAPTLFMGGLTGFILARFLNMLNIVSLPEENFALVGMASLMAGVMHAPLTAIFLIAEITGGYQLFLPLIIASTISYLTIMYFEPHSIYHKRLARRKQLITHNKDQAILRLINMWALIEKDFSIIKPTQTLGDLVRIISKSKRNIFPVVDNNGKLLGVVLLDDIRSIIFNADVYDSTLVETLMIYPPATITKEDSMEDVVQMFKETGAWNLPVTEKDKYVGFISKSKLFSIYRRWLMNITSE